MPCGFPPENLLLIKFAMLYCCSSGIGIGASTVLIVVLLVWFFQCCCKKQKFARFKAGFTSCNPSSNSELQLGGSYFGVPIFSYAELAEATNNFSEKNKIGDGGFGTVYYGKKINFFYVSVKAIGKYHMRNIGYV